MSGSLAGLSIFALLLLGIPTLEIHPVTHFFLDGQREGWTLDHFLLSTPPPQHTYHAATQGTYSGGWGLTCLCPSRASFASLASAKERLDFSDSRAQTCRVGSTIWGRSPHSGPSPGLYQRFHPEKECEEWFGSPCSDGCLEHTHRHATCTPFGT